jgi:hypothetical protein
MSPSPDQKRDFGETKDRAIVLLELAGDAVPSSLQQGRDIFKVLAEECGVEALDRGTSHTFLEKEVAPASGPRSRDTRFFEVRSRDSRSPVDVVKSIIDSAADDFATVLPVPFAIPAIAPSSAERAAWIKKTPDFHMLQTYTGGSPDGLGFADVAHLEGADGAGITVIDLEGGWNLGHEALSGVRFNLWAGTPSGKFAWADHGTAVSSILFAARDGVGISGLVPAARGALASIFAGNPSRQYIAQQIDACRKLLTPGDVLLVEVQRPGPGTDFEQNEEQRGYLPTSFWPDVRESIRRCVLAGISVVEVAGNGGVNLTASEFGGAFDQTGSTTSVIGAGDSGGIMVGAGCPPRLGSTARSRLLFSNFGERLDCQAWGESVVAAGYGDLWGNAGSDDSYTGQFLGTSSAGPLIAAVVAAVQGRHRRKHGKPVHPLVLRQILASYGSPQPAGETERIGPQPNLPEIFTVLDLL